MNKTTTKLQITQDAYETMTLEFYMRWCESLTGNVRQFQSILANKAINAYFLMELTKSETEFHKLTDLYVGSTTVSPLDFKKCYNECTYRLFSLRPVALLEDLKIKGKAQGIPVFNLSQN
ncbi:BrnA antitoxin family protein [Flavobacterium sp. I-SCBP12n]|uniref:BrnA antitoxin family protein n=1 Tax=Flavobacterium pygoscelis TaxID=2893176 RepID=A0A9X2BM26_9FLAO|nr:BrnA antitoxin family protein [Flavobacterium pygoscelis]MCK8143169.1 BrnA antitoxin family protein [Flavobacterium pygoscelis]